METYQSKGVKIKKGNNPSLLFSQIIINSTVSQIDSHRVISEKIERSWKSKRNKRLVQILGAVLQISRIGEGVLTTRSARYSERCFKREKNVNRRKNSLHCERRLRRRLPKNGTRERRTSQRKRKGENENQEINRACKSSDYPKIEISVNGRHCWVFESSLLRLLLLKLQKSGNKRVVSDKLGVDYKDLSAMEIWNMRMNLYIYSHK